MMAKTIKMTTLLYQVLVYQEQPTIVIVVVVQVLLQLLMLVQMQLQLQLQLFVLESTLMARMTVMS